MKNLLSAKVILAHMEILFKVGINRGILVAIIWGR
jgi:hypothetical protein